MKRFIFTALAVAISLQMYAQVRVKDEGRFLQLSNEKITVTLNKENADISRIVYDNQDLLGNKGRVYLLGPGFSMYPSHCSIVRQSDALVEVSFLHDADNHFRYDLHYVLLKNEPGIYCFLVQSHHRDSATGNYGQTRFGIRANEALFDYHLVRDSIQGPMPPMAKLTREIQDWTYQLEDSSFYTKYDYADYIEGRHVHGMAGTRSGLGMFIVQPSHDYLNGGPTKQYNTVHSTPFLMNMFNCGHFLLDRREGDNLISSDWTKLNGPFLLYFNKGADVSAVWNNAKNKAASEKKQWPYQWMQHPEYPLERGKVSGTLQVGGKKIAAARIILGAPGYDWQTQSQQYLYSTQTNEKGEFLLEHVRPGRYTLFAIAPDVTREFRQEQIVVESRKTTATGTLSFPGDAYGKRLWQIGEADRTTRGFKGSEGPRNYHRFLETPAQLRYETAKHRSGDWHYAQTKNGRWDIVFNMPAAAKGEARLTICIAGAARNPQPEIFVNNKSIGKRSFGNDASVYRSAIAGGYYQQWELRFPASLITSGENTVSIVMSDLKHGAGILYDAIRLEVNEKEELLFSEDFGNNALSNQWIVEKDERDTSARVEVRNGKLLLDTKGGVTVWLNKKLSGNIRIECKRKILVNGLRNDRLSDMNFFWMAQNPFSGCVKRSGAFPEYDSLNMYYAGIGGNYNTTSRFRKYQGGDRRLVAEYSDPAHLLTAGKEYLTEIIVKNGSTVFSLDGQPFFQLEDQKPYTEGYFGIRSTFSRQQVYDIRVYKLLD